MFCGKCGKELRDNAAFCGSCGNPVNKTREVSVGGTRRSPVNDPRRVKQTNYGLEKKLGFWNVHKVKKPELYGGYSNWTYWLLGLLGGFLAWPIGLIVYLVNLKSKSPVRKCQAQNLLLVAGIGFILMLGVIVEQGNEGKKVDNTGLVAADGTTYKRKEQNKARTERAGWEFLKWGMRETEVETLLKANGFLDKSRSLDSTAADEIDLTYDSNPNNKGIKRVGNKLPMSSDTLGITELTGYEIQRPGERRIIDTFVFYQGCLVGVVTRHYDRIGDDHDTSSFSSALKEKYGGNIIETGDEGYSFVRFRYESKSLNITMYTFYYNPFNGIEINYSDPERIKSAINKEMMRREEEKKEKVKKAKDIL